MFSMSQPVKVVAIIQARMTSSRLPGKVLKEIAGFPMLYHVVNRVMAAKKVDEVVVATTKDAADDLILKFCLQNNYNCFRGNSYDVLDRYFQAAVQTEADVIVRITSDCPLMDSAMIDMLVDTFLSSDVDFLTNRLPPPWKRTYPIGLDVEIVRFSGLERAWREAQSPFEREHVMPYFYDKPGRFKIQVVDHDPDFGEKRLTVDTPEDFELISRLFNLFHPRIDFSWLEAIEQLQKHPEIEKINQGVTAKNMAETDKRFGGLK